MATQALTIEILKDYQDKDIKKICDCDYTDKSLNHCAHFVGHALGLNLGYTCKDHTGKGSTGATLRVHEIFSTCPRVGKWSDRGTMSPCLIFITAEDHVDLAKKIMDNHPQKHIGIFFMDSVWHYSNGRDKVVKQTPAEVLKHFGSIYRGKIALFYGAFPASAKYLGA